MKAKQREWAKASRARKKEAKKASDPQPEPSSVPAAPLESDPQPEVELPSSRESSPSASDLQPDASPPSPQSDAELLSSHVPPSTPTPLPRKRRAPTPDDATEDSEQDVAVSSTSQR